jgi:hypothetical protein
MLSGKEDVKKKAAASARKLDRLSHFLDALYCNQLKQYPVIIVENETDMRGVDFRAPQKGITFVVMQPFTNERSFIQGMGRVGRHNDAATRWRLDGMISMHDLDAEAQSFIQLVGIANEYEPKKEMKPVGKGKKAVKGQIDLGKNRVAAEMKPDQNATMQDGKKQEDPSKVAAMQMLFK